MRRHAGAGTNHWFEFGSMASSLDQKRNRLCINMRHRLLLWLRDNPNVPGHFVLAADLKRIYPHLCYSMGWQPYPWNTLARELRSLTGNKKRYCWHDRKRLRVYSVRGAAKRPTR